jgi:antagonist of KipI
MSLQIIKQGILDTIQDLGRYGYQHFGINPGGVMDFYSAQIVNTLVGNNKKDAVIEMHFPAPVILFQEETMIAIGGADFSATINNEKIPQWQPIIVGKNSLLQFHQWKTGARCYLAIREKLHIDQWLNSRSTNIKAACGGFNGRALLKGDVINFTDERGYKNFLQNKDYCVLPWKADIDSEILKSNTVSVVFGNEWNWLAKEAQKNFLSESFLISSSADRMGYRLKGILERNNNEELVSCGVSYGTIQLLSNGELIILMADHQTTGGYPRIANVVTAHLPSLSQMKPGDEIRFQQVDQTTAENLIVKQQQYLLQLQNACKFRLQEFINAGNAIN